MVAGCRESGAIRTMTCAGCPVSLSEDLGQHSHLAIGERLPGHAVFAGLPSLLQHFETVASVPGSEESLECGIGGDNAEIFAEHRDGGGRLLENVGVEKYRRISHSRLFRA